MLLGAPLVGRSVSRPEPPHMRHVCVRPFCRATVDDFINKLKEVFRERAGDSEDELRYNRLALVCHVFRRLKAYQGSMVGQPVFRPLKSL